MNVATAARTRTIRFSTVHRTDYSYGATMSDGYTVAHLLPRDTPHQRVESAAVDVEPPPDEYEEHIDPFGNRVVRLGMHRPHDRLRIVGRSVVAVDVVAPDDPALHGGPSLAEAAQAVRDARGDRVAEIGPFVGATSATPALAQLGELTDDLFDPARPLVDVLRGLSERIHRELQFDAEFTTVSTPHGDVLDARRACARTSPTSRSRRSGRTASQPGT
jgi:hypothetical protein